MTDRDILIKALEKCKMPGVLRYAKQVTELLDDLASDYYYHFIFSKWFAEQFWGEDKYILYIDGEWDGEEHTKEEFEKSKGEYWKVWTPAWRFYQHNMLDEVQEGKDPLQYIERFL